MTTLVLMRHGVAEGDHPGGDGARRLTAHGREQARRAAAGLVALGVHPDVVVTSPLVRCVQTADLVGAAAACPVEHDRRLAPGMTADDLLEIVIAHPDADVLLACSHQPGLTYALSDLTGCGYLEFKRPGVAVITLDVPRPGGGTLAAVLPPRILRAAG